MGKCDPFRVGKIGGSRSVGGERSKRSLAHGYSIDPLRGSAMAIAFSAASKARRYNELTRVESVSRFL